VRQKRGQFSIDDLSRAEVIEQASFYRSLGGAGGSFVLHCSTKTSPMIAK
jgi:hypothetical protein